MNPHALEGIAKRLMAPEKGILAADESNGTADKRLLERGIPQTEEMRRTWRELLFTTPEIEKDLSGIILYDETIRQTASNGMTFPELLKSRGIIPGIKVDKGTVPLPNFPDEKVTEGLDGLAKRLEEYRSLGAEFTKWRSVIAIGANTPTDEGLEANAYGLTAYAAIVQEAGLVPIIEPEVLLDGTHTLAQSEETIAKTLAITFAMLKKYRVHLPGLILKTSMVLPGKDSGTRATTEEIAEATIRALTKSVPKEVGGVVFLSGGQSSEDSIRNLNTMATMKSMYPWRLTFSYSRGLQNPAMDIWMGQAANTVKAQEVFMNAVHQVGLASEGKL